MVDLDVEDLTPAFGAQVSGLDPKAPLDEDTRRALQDLFDRRGVLLFRDLDLTHGEQVRLSKMLIRQEDAPGTEAAPLEDKFYISNRRADSAAPFGRLQFHSDTMWADQPFEVLSLYGVDVEPADHADALRERYQCVEDAARRLRGRVEGLDALHTAGAVRRGDLTERARLHRRASAHDGGTDRPSPPAYRRHHSVRLRADDEGSRRSRTRGERAAARGTVRAPLRPGRSLEPRLARARLRRLGQPRDPARPAERHDGRPRAHAPQGGEPGPESAA